MDTVQKELDERHAEAQLAFARKDLDAYRELFSPYLYYRQRNGRVIGRDDLMRDVAIQFRRLDSVKSAFIREDLNVTGEEVRETLIQEATATATAFGLVHRRWKIIRRGIYTWRVEEGRWVIKEVEVLSETMTSAGWWIGSGVR